MHLIVSESAGDEDLIREFTGSGNIEAFNELIRRYKVPIRKIIYTVLCTTESGLADDAEQEVLLCLYRSLGKFRFRSSFRTWLYTICRNKALDVLKKEKRARNPIPVDQPLQADPEDPEIIYLKKERKEELFEALSQLEEKERTIIVLKELELLPLEEVSKIMKMPVGTIKSKLHRSRKKLERLMEDKYEET